MGASNKPADNARSEANRSFIDRLMHNTTPLKRLIDAERDAFEANRNVYKTAEDMVLARAKRAEEVGAGRCGEQASVAFKYLWENTRNVSFCLVELNKNHEFIIVGASPRRVGGVVLLSNLPDWEDDAVICDPWHGKAFAVKTEWRTEIVEILKKTEPNVTYASVTIRGFACRALINTQATA